jgi:hypothetical protein
LFQTAMSRWILKGNKGKAIGSLALVEPEVRARVH